MKKIITLCLFAFAILLGTESVAAQNSLKDISAEAQERTESLSKHLGLDSAQKDKIYLAFREYGRYKMNLENGSISSDKLSMEKIKDNLESKIKAVLTGEQFEKYKLLLEKEN